MRGIIDQIMAWPTDGAWDLYVLLVLTFTVPAFFAGVGWTLARGLFGK
jgi:hypothetical protein